MILPQYHGTSSRYPHRTFYKHKRAHTHTSRLRKNPNPLHHTLVGASLKATHE